MSLLPTPAFAGARLHLATIRAGAPYRRIVLSRFPDPLGYGLTPSRFSDPRLERGDDRFGVVYLGSTLKVCFLEAVLRDRRNGVVGNYLLGEEELRTRKLATIAPTRPLRVVDLTGDGPIRMGIPSDAVRGTQQELARAWSVAIHDHPTGIDGILYPSRLNEDRNLAIFTRARSALHCQGMVALYAASGLGAILDDLAVELV